VVWTERSSGTISLGLDTGKPVHVIGTAAGGEDTFVKVSWCERGNTTSGTNIRKFFGNCRGRLMSRHCTFLGGGAAGRKQADSMCLSVLRGGTLCHNTAHQSTTVPRNVATPSEGLLPLQPRHSENLKTRNIDRNGDKRFSSPYRAVTTLRLLYKPVS